MGDKKLVEDIGTARLLCTTWSTMAEAFKSTGVHFATGFLDADSGNACTKNAPLRAPEQGSPSFTH
ncbi:uncharacterized protein N7482_003487 [Penicillium canariense]|uniref:Uncharacterized protein n=1 Tax=Penicillium canariense TaxID=189055 RepID=A0A9W9I6W0_9EURO|nr:uncharacterized protein N7482_003487 [Penicillium canariense]KAJ5167893.1 hypothetical protein N7482_003487 [Penicillium canariense]